MNKDLNKTIKILEKYNQEEIIPFLENGKNTVLINQILNIDFDGLKELYKKTMKTESVQIAELQPVLSLNPDKLSQEKVKEIENIGIDIVKKNKFAVVTMAGRARNKITDIVNQKVHLD